MKFKKNLLLLGLAFIVLGFNSCAKKKDGKVTLVVWESSGGPDRFIRKAAEIYMERHPDIEVKYVHVESSDSVGNLVLDGPAGVGPDVFAAPHDKLGFLAEGGYVLSTKNADSIKERALGACTTALTYDGVMYGYPVSAETYTLFYNKKLISQDKIPQTWEELKAFCEKFNPANPGKYGFVMNTGEGYYTIIFTTLNGNRLFGVSGTDTSETYLNTPDAVKGMEFFKSLRPVLNISAGDLDTAHADGLFQSGKAALYITGPWNIANFLNAGLDFGVTSLPCLPGSDVPAASFSGTRAMFVSAYTDHPDEANDFAEFLVSDEIQKLRFEITGAIPGMKVPVESPYIQGFMKQLDYAFPMPSIPKMDKFWQVMNSASKNIWNGKADVKEELDTVNKSILAD